MYVINIFVYLYPNQDKCTKNIDKTPYNFSEAVFKCIFHAVSEVMNCIVIESHPKSPCQGVRDSSPQDIKEAALVGGFDDVW